MKINAIVMASGLSKRMGENKLFFKLGERCLYQITFDLLKKLDLDEVIIVSSYDQILKEARDYGYKAIFNDNNEVGKSSSIKLGVKECEDRAMMFFVADQPLLTEKTCNKLIEKFKKDPVITYPVVNERRGAPVIFPKEYKDDLLTLEGDQGGMIFAYKNKVNTVAINDEAELLDIDTIKVYEKIKDEYEK